MLEPHDRAPQIARVMKVVSADAPSSSFPALAPAPSPVATPVEKVTKFEDDYADSTSDSVTDEQPPSEDEWNVVSSKKSAYLGGVAVDLSGFCAPHASETVCSRY